MASHPAALQRVVVIGTSGCGKTEFARRLAALLRVPHVELDALYWGRRWVARPLEDFRADVRRTAAGDRWVVDGNYRSVRDVLWPRATMVVWLDYSFATVIGRVLARTLRRSFTREPLWAGNRETLGRALFHPDSILHWVITTHGRRRRDYRRLMSESAFPGIEWRVLARPREGADWLAALDRSLDPS